MSGNDGDGFDVDTARAGTMADAVSSAGQIVFDQAESVRVNPDVGRSTDEVRAAFEDLAAAVAGLADQTGGLADRADVAAGRYRTEDEAAEARLREATRGGGR